MNKVAKIYKCTGIKTSSNPRIVCMLHSKCVQLVQQAFLASGKLQQDLITQAQNILAELEHALIIEDELSKGLFYIYDYCYSLLDDKDVTVQQRAIPLLSQLRDTFYQLLSEQK